MPIIEGPVATLLVAIALVAAVIAWLARRALHRSSRRAPEPDDVDHEELDLAEREMRNEEEVESDNEIENDDWGPGAGGRRV